MDISAALSEMWLYQDEGEVYLNLHGTTSSLKTVNNIIWLSSLFLLFCKLEALKSQCQIVQ